MKTALSVLFLVLLCMGQTAQANRSVALDEYAQMNTQKTIANVKRSEALEAQEICGVQKDGHIPTLFPGIMSVRSAVITAMLNAGKTQQEIDSHLAYADILIDDSYHSWTVANTRFSQGQTKWGWGQAHAEDAYEYYVDEEWMDLIDAAGDGIVDFGDSAWAFNQAKIYYDNAAAGYAQARAHLESWDD